jgi:mRNA interferase MazF
MNQFDRGDIVIINLDPVLGRETGKRRPVYVLTQKNYNRSTGMAWVCPITTHPQNNAFEIPVQGKKISGFIIANKMRSVDLQQRQPVLVEKADPSLWDDVKYVIEALLA